MKKQTEPAGKTVHPKPSRGETVTLPVLTSDNYHLLRLARQDPRLLTPAHHIQLQRTFGNHALVQLLNKQPAMFAEKANRPAPPIQTKLVVNAVGDKYEQEADAVAKEVVQKLNAPQPNAAAGVPAAPPHAQRQTGEEEPIAQRIQRQETPHSAVAGLQTVPPTLQRQVPEEDELQLQRQETEDEELQLQRQELEEEEPQALAMAQRQPALEEEEMQLQRQELPEEEELQLQRQELEEELQNMAMAQRQPQDFTHGGPVDSHIEAQINQSRGGGRPMEDSIRQPMEQAFGADFSDVRIHTDTQAHNLNEAIQARAFTLDKDIFFNEGEFNPIGEAGQKLIAHELTHT